MPEGKPLLDVLDGLRVDPPPIWLMRQAGRFLPEYRALRAKAASFMDFAYNPSMAAEATLQPVRRFGFDAAILFSDILVIPDALGSPVSFVEGEGPRLQPIADPEGLRRLHDAIDLDRLGPVFEAIDRVRTELPPSCAMLGFCGAPWTVASYMIAGRGTPDLAPSRLFAYRYPQAFDELLDRLVEASIVYLTRQFAAGVEAVQIFESFGAAIPAAFLETWSLSPIRRIIAGLRATVGDARVIVFLKGCRLAPQAVAAATGASAVGLDWATDPSMISTKGGLPLQGNLDPLALLAGGHALDAAIARVFDLFAGQPHIFNLGHGVVPETPVANVERLLRQVRGSVAGDKFGRRSI